MIITIIILVFVTDNLIKKSVELNVSAFVNEKKIISMNMLYNKCNHYY